MPLAMEYGVFHYNTHSFEFSVSLPLQAFGNDSILPLLFSPKNPPPGLPWWRSG